MYEKLDAYLEEISHYLGIREEREEILSEIRSHILEKAAQEGGEVNAATLERVIAGYGPARRVAERYLDGHEVIAPAYKRFLFRYTALVFAFHAVATLAAVIFKTEFYLFPLLFVPRLGVVQALMYLPTALLCDFGIVALILFLVTRSGKDIKLPWPKFSVDLDEVRPRKGLLSNIFGLAAMTALTGAALYFYFRSGTIFFANLDFRAARPLFTPDAGNWLSLTLIGLWAVETVRLAVRLFTPSRWADVAKNAVSLVIVGWMLSRPLGNPFAVHVPEPLVPYLNLSITITLLLIAASVAVELVKSLVFIARQRLGPGRPGGADKAPKSGN